MKTPAAIYTEREKSMVIDDIDIPEPGPSHVVVKQFATGVCHSQIHELNRPNPLTPLVLGHESTGVVVATGSAMGINRQPNYRAVYSSPTGILMWTDAREKKGHEGS